MAALSGIEGFFNLSEQSIHLRYGEFTTGADRAVTGHGGEYFFHHAV